jgi:hypothetical protein
MMKFNFDSGPEDNQTACYPKFVVAIVVKSSTLPEKLIQFLQKKVETFAEGLAKEGKFHAAASYDFVDKILQNNNLIPCFMEVAMIKKVLAENKSEEKDEIKTFEKAGKLKLKLK